MTPRQLVPADTRWGRSALWSGSRSDLLRARGDGDHDLWAVGTAGTILHWDAGEVW